MKQNQHEKGDGNPLSIKKVKNANTFEGRGGKKQCVVFIKRYMHATNHQSLCPLAPWFKKKKSNKSKNASRTGFRGRKRRRQILKLSTQNHQLYDIQMSLFINHITFLSNRLCQKQTANSHRQVRLVSKSPRLSVPVSCNHLKLCMWYRRTPKERLPHDEMRRSLKRRDESDRTGETFACQSLCSFLPLVSLYSQPVLATEQYNSLS